VIPAGSSAQLGASIVGGLVDQSLNAGLQPNSCQVSGANGSADIGTVYQQTNPQIVFSAPPSWPGAPTSWLQDVTCDVGGPVIAETVKATASPFYASPAGVSLVAGGNSVDVSLLFTNQDPYCDNIWYTGELFPVGAPITASFYPSSDQLTLWAPWNTPTTEAYTLQIETNGCNGGPYYTIELPIFVTQCVPTSCYANSCQGTISNGCGGTLNCSASTSCASPDICMAGQCGVCPSGEIYNATVEECVSDAPPKPPSGGGCRGTTCE